VRVCVMEASLKKPADGRAGVVEDDWSGVGKRGNWDLPRVEQHRCGGG